MTVATPEAPEALVSQPPTGVIFASRRSELRLVVTPKRPVFGTPAGGFVGGQVSQSEGITLAFRGGQLLVPHDGDVISEEGTRVPAADVLTWLRSHRLFGDAMGGFWEVHTAAPPVSKDEIERIVNAALALDVPALEAILAAEQTGWERDEVIDQVQATIGKIEAAVAAQAQQAEPKAKPAAKAAARS